MAEQPGSSIEMVPFELFGKAAPSERRHKKKTMEEVSGSLLSSLSISLRNIADAFHTVIHEFDIDDTTGPDDPRDSGYVVVSLSEGSFEYDGMLCGSDDAVVDQRNETRHSEDYSDTLSDETNSLTCFTQTDDDDSLHALPTLRDTADTSYLPATPRDPVDTLYRPPTPGDPVDTSCLLPTPGDLGDPLGIGNSLTSTPAHAHAPPLFDETDNSYGATKEINKLINITIEDILITSVEVPSKQSDDTCKLSSEDLTREDIDSHVETVDDTSNVFDVDSNKEDVFLSEIVSVEETYDLFSEDVNKEDAFHSEIVSVEETYDLFSEDLNKEDIFHSEIEAVVETCEVLDPLSNGEVDNLPHERLDNTCVLLNGESKREDPPFQNENAEDIFNLLHDEVNKETERIDNGEKISEENNNINDPLSNGVNGTTTKKDSEKVDNGEKISEENNNINDPLSNGVNGTTTKKDSEKVENGEKISEENNNINDPLIGSDNGTTTKKDSEKVENGEKISGENDNIKDPLIGSDNGTTTKKDSEKVENGEKISGENDNIKDPLMSQTIATSVSSSSSDLTAGVSQTDESYVPERQISSDREQAAVKDADDNVFADVSGRKSTGIVKEFVTFQTHYDPSDKVFTERIIKPKTRSLARDASFDSACPSNSLDRGSKDLLQTKSKFHSIHNVSEVHGRTPKNNKRGAVARAHSVRSPPRSASHRVEKTNDTPKSPQTEFAKSRTKFHSTGRLSERRNKRATKDSQVHISFGEGHGVYMKSRRASTSYSTEV